LGEHATSVFRIRKRKQENKLVLKQVGSLFFDTEDDDMFL
jgi:hypothetical protein